MNEDTENKTLPMRREFSYRPKVKVGKPNLFVELGRYMVGLYFKDIESLGVVAYHHVALVADADFNECLYVTAEWNPMDGPSVIYLGTFETDRHSTVLRSPLLALQIVFFLATCELTRRVFGLSQEQAPITEAENQVVPLLVELVNKTQPDWRTDEGSVRLLDLIIDGVKAQHPDLRDQLYTKTPNKLGQLLKWKR